MLPSRDWHGGTREEYQTQHFGFGSQQLTIALRGVLEQSIVDNVREMETSLLNLADLVDEDRRELSLACDKLISMYFLGAGPAFSRIGCELDRLMEIPDSAVLPDDEERALPVSDEGLERLRAEVASLEKRVQRAALMEALMKVEEEEQKSVEKHCELARQTMASLDSFGKKLQTRTEVMSKLRKECVEVCDGLPFVKNKEDFL